MSDCAGKRRDPAGVGTLGRQLVSHVPLTPEPNGALSNAIPRNGFCLQTHQGNARQDLDHGGPEHMLLLKGYLPVNIS